MSEGVRFVGHLMSENAELIVNLYNGETVTLLISDPIGNAAIRLSTTQASYLAREIQEALLELRIAPEKAPEKANEGNAVSSNGQ